MVKISPMDYGYIVRWQADLVNTKENLLPVCDYPYHKIKENLPHWEELENLSNYALVVNKSITHIPSSNVMFHHAL